MINNALEKEIIIIIYVLVIELLTVDPEKLVVASNAILFKCRSLIPPPHFAKSNRLFCADLICHWSINSMLVYEFNYKNKQIAVKFVTIILF